ncbi:hypothetical protein IJE86_04490 [bacterium]|nr:hypothetical protein [bacterium]
MGEIILQVSAYLGAIGVIAKTVSKILDNKLTPIQDEIKSTHEKIDHNEKDSLRYKILSFANSLHNGDSHTRQEYETIFFFYDKYEAIIKRLDVENGYLEIEMAFIRETYKKKYGGVV